MAAKKVWLTWLPTGEDAPAPQAAVAALSKSGLDVGGAPWIDDLKEVAWEELSTMLSEPGSADIWVIAGRKEDFAQDDVRYGLSLCSAVIEAARAKDLHRIVVGLDGKPSPDELPTPLRGHKLVDGSKPWSAAIVVAGHGKPTPSKLDFRLNVIAHKMVGQYIEVGPLSGEWKGAMIGVSEGATILIHAVGKRGELPERTVLNYPMEGLKAEIGGTEFVAWSVQNPITAEESYYVKVDGYPSKLLVGEHPAEDDAEAWVIELK
ncbi:MAG TPA: hypothetical protein DEA08_07645 [Planctomycetes bacterium]|nr:hypothetical protein [Planctomycetota bacterium]